MRNFKTKLITMCMALMFTSPAFALNMMCPYNNTTLVSASGTAYTTGASGSVGSVQAGQDISSLSAQGCVTSPTSVAANGLTATNVKLLELRNPTGTSLAASAAAGVFGSSITLGTSQYLVGEAAQGNTKTDIAIYEYVLPANYVAGQNITITVNANLTGTGTNNASTALVNAYLQSNTGTQGADISANTTQPIIAAGSDLAFTITGTTLTPGSKIVLKLTTATIESGNSNSITARLGSIRVN